MPARLLQDERQGRSRAGPALFIFCRRSRAMRWRCGMSTAAVHFRSRIPLHSACVSPRAVFGRGRIRRMPQVCLCSAKALFPRCYRLRRIRALSIALDRGGPQIARNGACGSVRCRRRWLYCAVRVRGMAVRPVIGRCAAGIKQRSRPSGRLRRSMSCGLNRFPATTGSGPLK